MSKSQTNLNQNVTITTDDKKTTIEGTYSNWAIGEGSRKYATVTLPFSIFNVACKVMKYSASTGQGNQRDQAAAHVKNLRVAMENGTYTPAPLAVNLTNAQSKAITLDEKKGTFKLVIEHKKPAWITDGGHREAGVLQLLENLNDELKFADEETERQAIEAIIEQCNNLPITATFYFNGSPQQDFMNLQAGRNADKSHLLSMKIQKKLVEDDDSTYKTAFGTAQVLNKVAGPFTNTIKFDGKGAAALPFATICAGSSSDQSYSLLGLATVCNHFTNGKKAAKNEVVADFIVAAHKALDENASEVLEHGKVLTTIANSGGRGSATMMVGLGIALAYRVMRDGRTEANEEDLNRLVASAKLTLNETVNGSFSVHDKRSYLQVFVADFLGDVDIEKLEGVPTELMEILSHSSYAVQKPKAVKAPAKKRSRRSTKKTELPNVDDPVNNEDVVDETVTNTEPQTETPQVEVVEEKADGEKVETAPWEEGDQSLQG